jgi:hypothetical protein
VNIFFNVTPQQPPSSRERFLYLQFFATVRIHTGGLFTKSDWREIRQPVLHQMVEFGHFEQVIANRSGEIGLRIRHLSYHDPQHRWYYNDFDYEIQDKKDFLEYELILSLARGQWSLSPLGESADEIVESFFRRVVACKQFERKV